LLVILAWGPQSSVAQPTESVAQQSGFIYVVRRGWHVDIGFAAAALEPPLQSLAAQFPGARYIFFGFGDKHYFLAKNRNGPVLLGALWPGQGLVLATAVASTPQAAFGDEHVIALAVSVSQVRAAQAFIGRSLRTDVRQGLEQEGNGVLPYAPGPYEGSLYFAATPKYSAFHTCNTWVAEALKAAPLPVHSAGVIFASQLWSQVRRLALPRASLPSTAQLQGGFDPS
jgi:Protein of unknown function (DUF2459)